MAIDESGGVAEPSNSESTSTPSDQMSEGPMSHVDVDQRTEWVQDGLRVSFSSSTIPQDRNDKYQN